MAKKTIKRASKASHPAKTTASVPTGKGGLLPLYQIVLTHEDDREHSIPHKWKITLIDNSKLKPSEREINAAVGDDTSAMDILKDFMRMRE